MNNQEIRNCIYQGTLNTLLQEISKSETFKSLFDISETKKYRFSNEELLLRGLALSNDFENYHGPLAKYLNTFMSDNRDGDIDDFKADLEFAITTIYEKILGAEPFPRLSKATIEAIFVAIIRNKGAVLLKTDEQLKSMYHTLRDDELFSVDALKEGLAATDKVIARLTKAVEIFS